MYALQVIVIIENYWFQLNCSNGAFYLLLHICKITKPPPPSLSYRAIQAPLVPRPSQQRFWVSLHTHQPQDGPSGWTGWPAHRPEHPATLPAASQWAHIVGWPIWSVLPHRRGRLDLCALRVPSQHQRKPQHHHWKQHLRLSRPGVPDGGKSHQLQGGTTGFGPHQPRKILHDDCVQLNESQK